MSRYTDWPTLQAEIQRNAEEMARLNLEERARQAKRRDWTWAKELAPFALIYAGLGALLLFGYYVSADAAVVLAVIAVVVGVVAVLSDN